jgi:hypothetical protein
MFNHLERRRRVVRNVQLKTNGLSVVFVCVLSLGMMIPGVVLAGQNKVDVCHSEGNGSYHLINIAAPAYPTHVSHGDARVGEPVPGNEGFVFDENCNLVEVVVDECPCDFSETVYLALAADENLECYDDNTGVELTVGDRANNGDFFWLSYGNYCVVYNNGFSAPPGFIMGLTASEEEACRQDIFAVVTSLNIPACEP